MALLLEHQVAQLLGHQVELLVGQQQRHQLEHRPLNSMETRLAPTNTLVALEAAVTAAVAELAEGHPVALPTETVYGLAADALRPDAVVKIFEAKERPLFDPLIVHLPGEEWLEKVAVVPARSRTLVAALVKRFWPGPLTLVLPRQEIVPDIVTIPSSFCAFFPMSSGTNP